MEDFAPLISFIKSDLSFSGITFEAYHTEKKEKETDMFQKVSLLLTMPYSLKENLILSMKILG